MGKIKKPTLTQAIKFCQRAAALNHEEAKEFARTFSDDMANGCEQEAIIFDKIAKYLTELKERRDNKAYWKLLPGDTAPSKVFQCSKCKNITEHKYYSDSGYYNYCKDCGALMVKGTKGKTQ